MTRRKASVQRQQRRALLGDIRALIEASRQRVASAVNAELTLLFWRIGQRIHTQVLAGQRAGYGDEILPTLAAQFRDYGRSFADRTCAGWCSSPPPSRRANCRRCHDN
jgi:hypothetical protein